MKDRAVRWSQNVWSMKGMLFSIIVLSVILLFLPSSVPAQQAPTPPEPVVAIHVSELTAALEGAPGIAWPSWHYFIMPESMKEALRSDGTPYVEVSDAAIAAGALLRADGSPKYPIVISLANEAVDDNEIDPLRAYVNAGGMLFMGASAFTRTAAGANRGDFALAAEMGLHAANPDAYMSWYSNLHFTKAGDHPVTADIPAGTLTWRMPATSEEVPLGISPSHSIHGYHYVFQVSAGSGATVLATGDAGPLVTTTAYGKGNFIYHAAAEPLIGHGGYDSAGYGYLLFRRAIEWAFQAANVPLIKLSPWRFEHDAAFIVRHDFENDQADILAIPASAAFEQSHGAKGDYYFCTGTLREEMTGDAKSTALAGLATAVGEGATIGSHNGGLPNPVNTSLQMADFDYWHWGPDEALDVTSFPTGTYTSGKEYAQASIAKSFQDIEGWLAGLDNGRTGCGSAGNCPRIWNAPYFNATRENSFDILEGLGTVTMSEQMISPFPHWTLSTQTAGKHYSYLAVPFTGWYVGTDVAQAMEDHTSASMRAAVDFNYNLGTLIQIYSHTPSASDNLEGEYVAYCTDSTAKPRMWAANAVSLYDWWKARSNASLASSYGVAAGTATAQATLTGATDPGTAVEVVISNGSGLTAGDIQVLLDGSPAGPAEYRISGNTVKVHAGNTVSTVQVTYPILNPLPAATSLSPAAVVPGSGAFVLTVNGSGFINGSVVRWNGSDRTTTYVSATSLTAQITAADVTSAGTAQVTVFNPTPGGGTSNALTFTKDGTPPNTTIGDKPASRTSLTDASFTFTSTEPGTFQCDLDGGGYSSCATPKTYSSLASGQTHTFSVRAIDVAGNIDATPATYSWTIDIIAPDTNITDQPANPTNQTGASFSFAATEAATFECQLDGAGFAACTSPKTYSSLASGQTHTFDVRATDLAGNLDPSPASYSWLIDTSAPNAPIVSGTSPTNDTTPTWTWTSGGGGGNGNYRYKLDSSDLSAGATPTSATSYTSPVLGDGTHTLYVQEQNSSGNWSLSGSFAITIDATAPDTTITNKPANPTNLQAASFAFTATESATFECDLDGGGYSSCASPKLYSSLVSGQTHTFSVRATDLLGNQDLTPATYSWMIDTVAPDTSITGQPANPTNQTTASFTFTATESGTFECQLDNGSYALCTSPKAYSSLASGQTHTFNVRAVDLAGNTDATPASYSWAIDTSALGLTISTTSSNPTRTSPIPVSVAFDKPVTDFDASDVTFVNGTMTDGSFAGSGKTYAFTVTPSGQGLVTVSIAADAAHDKAGNANGAASLSMTYDTTPPDTSITAHPANPTNLTSASFSFTATESATFQCQLDGGGYASCTSPKTYSGLAGGQTHTFDVRATDLGGTPDPTPASYSWGIDTTAPTVAISGPSLAVANSSAPVTFTVTYSGADSVTLEAAQITLNRTGTTNGTVTVTGSGNASRLVTISNITGVADGPLSISIAANTASDMAGNTAAAAGPSATFTVDNGSGTFDGKAVPDIADALKALRISAGLDVPSSADMAHGDVAPLVGGQRQPDGRIDVGDVVAILRKSAGLPSW